jgi:dinuclear metal center YbgI/SA1388 family protein
MIRLKQLIEVLEAWAPPALQESYDNCGLQCGQQDMVINGVMTTLDVTVEVLKEVIDSGANVIVAHHPLIFKPLKKITGANEVEQILLMAIKHEVAIYALHTNLDSVNTGVNAKLAELLGLEKLRILRPKTDHLVKLEVFVPSSHTQRVLVALGNAGAGQIGNYKNCSFRSSGTGSFTPAQGAQPSIGEIGKEEEVAEDKIEVIFQQNLQSPVLRALRESHPYEEIAYYLLPLQNVDQDVGAGMVGELKTAMQWEDWLTHISKALSLQTFRHSPPAFQQVQKIAICGGSGIFLIQDAIRSGAQVLLTADIKYHEYFDALGKITLIDVGHHQSETATRFLIKDYLSRKFPNIAVNFSKTDTNPVRNYLNR